MFKQVKYFQYGLFDVTVKQGDKVENNLAIVS